MKFLCDVHISRKLSKRLEQIGYTSIHVNDILHKWNTQDSEICEYADKDGLILITKDQDFRNNHLVTRKPKKLIKINLGNISNDELMQTFENHIPWIKNINNTSEFL